MKFTTYLTFNLFIKAPTISLKCKKQSDNLIVKVTFENFGNTSEKLNVNFNILKVIPQSKNMLFIIKQPN